MRSELHSSSIATPSPAGIPKKFIATSALRKNLKLKYLDMSPLVTASKLFSSAVFSSWLFPCPDNTSLTSFKRSAMRNSISNVPTASTDTGNNFANGLISPPIAMAKSKRGASGLLRSSSIAPSPTFNPNTWNRPEISSLKLKDPSGSNPILAANVPSTEIRPAT